MLARAFALAEAPDRALACAVRAMEVVRDLHSRVPSPYRAAYLAHPARQELREEFLGLKGGANGGPAWSRT